MNEYGEWIGPDDVHDHTKYHNQRILPMDYMNDGPVSESDVAQDRILYANRKQIATQKKRAQTVALKKPNTAPKQASRRAPVNEEVQPSTHVESAVANLISHGICVVPIGDTAGYLAQFEDYMNNVPEFKRDWVLKRTGGPQGTWTPGKHTDDHVNSFVDYRFAAGNFGAFNLASSYHVPLSRNIDTDMYAIFEPILAVMGTIFNLPHVEMIPDRLCFRPSQDMLGGDTVHRDVSAGLEASDLAFGGLVNLNTNANQGLTIQTGSHYFHSDQNGGSFTKVSADTAEGRYAMLHFDAYKSRIVIPPNHACIFFENILHEIPPGPVANDTFRKFIAFRLTRATTTVYKDNILARLNQSPLAHKGGTRSPLWPDKYDMNKEPSPSMRSRFQKRFASEADWPELWDQTTHRIKQKKPDYTLKAPYAAYTDIQNSLYRPHAFAPPVWSDPDERSASDWLDVRHPWAPVSVTDDEGTDGSNVDTDMDTDVVLNPYL
jgi:hypothetical protein